MDESDKKRKVSTASKTSASTKGKTHCAKGFLAVCQECLHVGLECFPCAQCNNLDMEIIKKINTEIPLDRGICYKSYHHCAKCFTVESLRQNPTRICSKCLMAGTVVMMENLTEDAKEKFKNNKYLPPCAQLKYNKCMDCFEAASYLGSYLPCKINEAVTIIEVTRSFDALLETGYELDENQIDATFKALFCELNSASVTRQKLCTLIKHHSQLCLCSICKWWIISNSKADDCKL